MSDSGFNEVLTPRGGLGTAGSSFGSFTTAKTVIPAVSLFTLPANYFEIGKALRLTVRGGVGSLVTTPGTITFQVMIGAAIAYTTGAIQLNNAGNTNLPFSLEAILVCRAIGSGTNANLMGMGVASSKVFVTAAGAAATQTHSILEVPATAPAVGAGFDSTIANIVDFFAAFSINDAANTVKIETYLVEALN